MARKRTKLERSQRQSNRLEKRLNGTRREAAKRQAREDVNQAVERIAGKQSQSDAASVSGVTAALE